MAAIIRCGHLGCCYIDTSALEHIGEKDVVWVPAYWDSDTPEGKGKVVDPTGAGNAFMGGLGAALDQGNSIHEGEQSQKAEGLMVAVLWATVAASLVIEQNGLPTLEYGREEDIWNGENPKDRVEKLRSRLRV